MRKIIVTEFVSLDGVMEDPSWTMPYWNDEIAEFKDVEQQTTDALLLGRVTYEGFAGAWSGSEADGAEFMNSVRKYVVSSTLNTAEWNNSTVIKDNIIQEITTLKESDGQDILIYGSAMLLQTLIQHNLIDQYRLLVYPVVVGKGKRLFQEGTTTTLKLINTQVFVSGVTALVYQSLEK